MDLSAVRDALKARLETISGLRSYAHVPDKPEPPCAIVAPSSCEFDSTFARGCDEIGFSILVLAARSDDRAGQAALDGFLDGGGPASVKAAVEVDVDLGGTVDTVRVSRWTGYGVREWAGVTYYAVEFSVEVIG